MHLAPADAERSYQAAVRCARRLGRLRPFELADAAGIGWPLAARYLRRMEQDGLVGPIDARGWRHVSGAQQARPRDRRVDDLRRLLARELHPDSGDEGERAIRTALFQRLWPQLQALAA